MGGPTHTGKGPHKAVRVKDDGQRGGGAADWSACLYCGRMRSTDHTGLVLLEQNDKHDIRLNHSQNEQSRKVKVLALGTNS